MFWIQYGIWYEKNVDNTLVFTVVAKRSRTLQLPMSCPCTGAQEAGREKSQSTGSKLANEIFHIM